MILISIKLLKCNINVDIWMSKIITTSKFKKVISNFNYKLLILLLTYLQWWIIFCFLCLCMNSSIYNIGIKNLYNIVLIFYLPKYNFFQCKYDFMVLLHLQPDNNAMSQLLKFQWRFCTFYKPSIRMIF